MSSYYECQIKINHIKRTRYQQQTVIKSNLFKKNVLLCNSKTNIQLLKLELKFCSQVKFKKYYL